ncbi:MAG: glycosyltransferase family 87 protein, partial [Candidatus Zixiibacteriota bacterium]
MPIAVQAKSILILKRIVVVIGVFSILLFFYQSLRNFNHTGGNDLTSYLSSSHWFFGGENPYDDPNTPPVRRYIYPLFLLLVVYPFTFLQANFVGKTFTATIWALVSNFCFFASVFTLWKYWGYEQKTAALFKDNIFKLSLIIILLHPFLEAEFLNSQANLFVLGCVVGFFTMINRRLQWAAALFLSVAVSLKIAPGVLLIYALLTKQYRAIVYT